MSDITELNDKLVSELREMAKSLGIAEADDLRKPQLISKIVTALMLYFGAYAVISGDLTVGELVAFNMLAGWVA